MFTVLRRRSHPKELHIIPGDEPGLLLKVDSESSLASVFIQRDQHKEITLTLDCQGVHLRQGILPVGDLQESVQNPTALLRTSDRQECLSY